MELKGKVIAVLEAKSGDSKKNPGEKWMSQEYVIETIEQYSKKMVFNVWGEERIKRFSLSVGKIINVKFDIDAREYNGRWFNQINAFDVTSEEEQAPVTDNPVTDNPAPAPKAVEEELPF